MNDNGDDINEELANEFIRERDILLRSLDTSKFVEFLARWGSPDPFPNALDETRLAGMHKARLYIKSFSDEEKQASRDWLNKNKYSSSVNFTALDKFR